MRLPKHGAHIFLHPLLSSHEGYGVRSSAVTKCLRLRPVFFADFMGFDWIRKRAVGQEFLALFLAKPIFLIYSPMEAEGIEPSSQDNRDSSLYMLRRCFDLGSWRDHRQPRHEPRRLYLARVATSDESSQPAVSATGSRASPVCRGCLN